MTDQINQQKCDEIFFETMKLYTSHEIPLNLMYLISGVVFCRIAQTLDRSPEEIFSDFKERFLSLPEPVVEE